MATGGATTPGERSALTGGAAKAPPERPPLPPYLVAEDSPSAVDLPGSGGCVVGWGLPYGKPTPDSFELQFGYAIRVRSHLFSLFRTGSRSQLA